MAAPARAGAARPTAAAAAPRTRPRAAAPRALLLARTRRAAAAARAAPSRTSGAAKLTGRSRDARGSLPERHVQRLACGRRARRRRRPRRPARRRLSPRRRPRDPAPARRRRCSITSPLRTPARSAGPSSVDRRRPRAPSGCVGEAGAVVTPSHGRGIASPCSSCGTIWRTVFEGTAKPMPMLPGHAGRRDLRVDADHVAAVVEQRAARVARVDRRVGLDHLVDREAVRRLDRAPEAGDDPLGGGAVEPERVADRDDEVADLDGARVGESQRLHASRHAIGVDRDDGEVARRVDCRARRRRSRRRPGRSARARASRCRRRARS